MNRTKTMTAEDLADAVLPLGGPHDPDTVMTAAAVVAQLIRRLNHATRRPDSLVYPADLNRVLGSINTAMWCLEQLLGQLADRAERFADDPRLCHERADQTQAVSDALLAAKVLRRAAEALRRDAEGRPCLGRPIEAAQQATSYLCYRD